MLCQRVLRSGIECHPVLQHQTMRRGNEDASTDTDAPAHTTHGCPDPAVCRCSSGRVMHTRGSTHPPWAATALLRAWLTHPAACGGARQGCR
jgi:hypothetical protein